MGSPAPAPALLRSFSLPHLALLLLTLTPAARATVTVYTPTQVVLGAPTLAPGVSYTGVAAYNPSTLVPPALPTPAVLTNPIPVNLQNANTPGLGVKQKGSFLGFSIEMSVTNQVLGKNSTFLQVPFLNLMANIVQRAGSVMVRVGGNTQESAHLVPVGEIPNGRVLSKNYTGVTGTTNTPPLDFTPDLLYMMRNISDLVNVHWFLGIPWFVTQPFDLGIVPAATEILGDYLLGFQAGNEPDMYNLHGHRGPTYGPFDYGGEISDFLTQLDAAGGDPTGRAKQLLIAPNIADFDWTPEQVWDTNLVDTFNANLAWLAVEKYPRDNCAATFGGPGANVTDPQSVLNLYLTHDAHTQLLQPYLNSTMYAQTKGKPFLMFETNTASCGGFLGISDAFAATLWGLDYALQMAHSNFSGAMFHLGGQNVFYNPFTAPPTNESTFHQWSVGSLYYSALVMAEAIGASNTTQVLNYGVDNLSSSTPIYGIYENGTPVRVAIVNYLNDPTGTSDVHAVISIAGGTLPSSVQVKYLLASSVTQKGNYTWAGQTFGGFFESDGRPMGTENITTVNCDTTAQACTIVVPAPGAALVFLNNAATETGGAPSQTFATTAKTKSHNTATVDPAVLSTSNGFRASDHDLAGTSKPPSAAPRTAQASFIAAGAVVATVIAVLVRAL